MNTQIVKTKLKDIVQKETQSPLDLYIAINEKQLDQQDWALLISTIDKEDLDALIAIHSWHKYSFVPESYLEILDYVIYDKDRLRAYKNLQKLSYEELVLFLAKTIQLEWFIEDKDYEGDPFLSEDRVFIIKKLNEKITDVLFEKAIGTISLAYLDDMTFGRKLCLDIMASNTLIQEEEALKKKDYILETLGIKPYQDTMKLYHYENPRLILKKLSKKIEKKYSFLKDINIPDIVRSFSLENIIIDQDLEKDMQLEFHTMLSSIITYNDVLRYGTKTIKDTIKRNLSYIELGVDIFKKSQKKSILSLLKHAKLSEIFRLGFSSVIEIKKYAKTIKALIDKSAKTILITPTEDIFIKNITKTIPLIKTEINKSAKPLNCVEDLKLAKETLDSIMKKIDF